MTRDHIALQLLAHGPLSRAEFVEITGWALTTCTRTLAALVDTGELQQPRRGVYALGVAA